MKEFQILSSTMIIVGDKIKTGTCCACRLLICSLAHRHQILPPFVPHGGTEGHRGTVIKTHVKLLNWNVEGLEAVLESVSRDIFSQFDICTLTETFLTNTSKTAVNSLYNIHASARQGERGRPIGGLACLLKYNMAPFRMVMKDENRLVIQTETF